MRLAGASGREKEPRTGLGRERTCGDQEGRSAETGRAFGSFSRVGAGLWQAQQQLRSLVMGYTAQVRSYGGRRGEET